VWQDRPAGHIFPTTHGDSRSDLIS